MEDLGLFIEVFRQDPMQAHDLLATWLNLVADLYSKSQEQSQRRANGATSSAPPGLQFSQSDLDKLLSDVAFFRSEILFPPQLDGRLVLEIYWEGGVITLRDVGAYVRWLRSTQDKVLTDLRNSIDLSESALSRLETGMLEQVRMKDVLSLDQELCREGELVRMSWEACALYPGSVRQRGRSRQFDRPDATWSDKELRLALAVIAVVRWWSYFELGDQVQISALRQSLRSALAPEVESLAIAG